MEGHGVFKQLFQRKGEVIQELIAEKVAVLTVDVAEVLDVDEIGAEGLLALEAALGFAEEAVAVIELGQVMNALALALEGEEKNGIHHGHDEAVEHHGGVETLDHNADDDDGEGLQQHAAHGAVCNFIIADETEGHKAHLADGDRIAQEVEGAAAVSAAFIEIEEPARPHVGDDGGNIQR